MANKLNTNAVGSAGEHRVISELLLRGHNPAVHIFDDGIDIVLQNGKTVQVKSSFLNKRVNRSSYYCFNLMSMRYNSSYQYKKSHKQIERRVADYFIFWGIDDNKFLIIPKDKVPKVKNFSIVLNPKKKGPGVKKTKNSLLEYKNKWEILK